LIILQLIILQKCPSYIDSGSGEAKPHLKWVVGPARRSPPTSLLLDSPIRAVGADCPEPGWSIKSLVVRLRLRKTSREN